jgi:hypothetical protein
MENPIYTLVHGEIQTPTTDTLSLLPETDRFGRALFRTDQITPKAVDPALVRERLTSAVTAVREAIRATGLSSAEVNLKFALDAKVGVVFLGETGIEASIEVKFEFKRDEDSVK